MATASALMSEEFPQVLSLRRQVPLLLSNIVARALARNPADRYQTADELRSALEGFLPQSQPHGTQAEVAAWTQEVLTVAKALGYVSAFATATPTQDPPESEQRTVPGGWRNEEA